MRRFLLRVRRFLARRLRRSSGERGLTAVEYEAVCLIAYEGQAAYPRAREQAEYCRSVGSPSGADFWTQVAVEVERRTGRAGGVRTKAQPR